jgi:opacity protein-like surface antigen
VTPLRFLLWPALGSILLLIAAPAAAQLGGNAEIRPYATLSVGVSFTPDLESDSFRPLTSYLFTESGPNVTVGGGVGALWGYVRHEVRADYNRAKITGVTPLLAITGVPTRDPAGETLGVTTLLYMVALRQTFLDEKLAVYGGIGIGAAYGKIPTGAVLIKDWQFGYSANLGVFYNVWRQYGLELGYRYVSATDFTASVISDPNIGQNPFNDGSFPFNLKWRSHDIVLSLRYSWGGGN